MTAKNRNFIILIAIVFSFGLAFWLRQIQRPQLPEIPETIVVGTTADYPPFAFKQDDQIVGFDIDVATESIKRLGKQIALKDTPFELLIPQTEIGVTHVVAADLSVTPERQKAVLFTKPYLTNNPLVVISRAQGAPLRSLANLTDKRVVVNAGYTADAYMSTLPHIAVDRVPSVAEALTALQNEKVDAFVTSAAAVPAIFDAFGQDSFHVFVIDDVNEDAALAVSKLYPKLAQALDAILDEMRNDGTLDQMKQKWNVQ